MQEITDNLFVGSDQDCISINSEFKVIHACKTCHQKGVGYSGNLSQSHPNYLIFLRNNNLYLNMVDMDRELLPKFTHPMVKIAMDFISENISKSKILIHCNQGESRAPSLGLIYLAKNNIINSDSYFEATKDFVSIYPNYNPGIGIRLYLNKNWNEILSL